MPTPRTALLALLLAVAPAAGRAAEIPLPPPPTGTSLQPSAPLGGYKVALLGGFLAQGEVGSASLQVDVGRTADFPQLTRFQIEWHLPVRVARPQWDGTLMRTIVAPVALGGGTTQEPVGTTKDTHWIFEAIPSARAVLPVAQGFALHAELGIGLAATAETHVEEELFVGHTTTRKVVLAPSINAALGLTYQLGDRVEVVFQPFVFGRRAKSDGATFSALWGLSYRL